MGSRYDNIKNMKKNGKDYKLTAIYKEIPELPEDIMVMTQEGDRFDLLAHQYYGDSSLWWYIAKANQMKFNNIPAGLTIRIPRSTEYAGIRNKKTY